MHRLTTTHTRRRHLYRQTVGQGHLYQGTYKSFSVATDEHLLTLCRYVELKPVRAGLIDRAENWPWSSTRMRMERRPPESPFPLATSPVTMPPDWAQFVNTPLTPCELDACRLAVTRGRPFGQSSWQIRTARQSGLDTTLRSHGRPQRHLLGA